MQLYMHSCAMRSAAPSGHLILPVVLEQEVRPPVAHSERSTEVHHRRCRPHLPISSEHYGSIKGLNRPADAPEERHFSRRRVSARSRQPLAPPSVGSKGVRLHGVAAAVELYEGHGALFYRAIVEDHPRDALVRGSRNDAERAAARVHRRGTGVARGPTEPGQKCQQAGRSTS